VGEDISSIHPAISSRLQETGIERAAFGLIASGEVFQHVNSTSKALSAPDRVQAGVGGDAVQQAGG
jgi:hypothetical protein